MKRIETSLAFLLASLSLAPAPASACALSVPCASRLSGVVSSGDVSDARPIANAGVAIYQAREGAPLLLARATTNARGEFSADLPKQGAGETRYAIATAGRIELMTILAAQDSQVRINEMTTVASAYSMAQFLGRKQISGKALPLQVAAGMFRNLASSPDGRLSTVLATAPNADQTNARRLMVTLSNILANCVRFNASCAPLFRLTETAVAKPATTLEAIISISRNPTNNLRPIFALGEPVRPYQPALTAGQGPDAPNELMRLDAFTIAVKVNRTGRKNSAGSELCPFGGPGNLVFDQIGYAWVTNNVVQGQAVSSNCFYVLKPDGSPSDGSNGTPNSPLFGGGVLGQGFGIARDPSGNIWAGNFGWGGVNPNGSVFTILAERRAALSALGICLDARPGAGHDVRPVGQHLDGEL